MSPNEIPDALDVSKAKDLLFKAIEQSYIKNALASGYSVQEGLFLTLKYYVVDGKLHCVEGW